jgi:hypothetical protein
MFVSKVIQVRLVIEAGNDWQSVRVLVRRG